MEVSADQRIAWAENTKNDEFNLWLTPQIRNSDGTLDLKKMYEIAESFGVTQRYDHLNPGQQRMNIGNRLRKIVGPPNFKSS